MSSKHQHPNRPHTSHEQNPEEKDKGQERESQRPHKNPTHQTDQASSPENMPESDSSEEE